MIITTVIMVLGAAGIGGQFALSRHAAAASHSSLWKPVDHTGEQAYWKARNGVITGKDLAAAQAQAAKLPTASQLPATHHASSSGGSIAQSPSGIWHPIGPAPINVGGYTTYAGRVSSLAVDQTTSGATTTIYLGAAGGGVWKTVNNGASWTPLTDSQLSLATGYIAIDPNNHNTLYVGTGEPNQSLDSYYGDGILKSTDGGATWTLLGQTFFGDRSNAIQKIIVNPRNSSQIFVAFTSGFAISNDGGSTYSLINSGIPSGFAVDDLGINPSTNPVTLYATVRNNGMYESTNGGTSWIALSTGLPTGSAWGRSALAVAPSNPSVIYTVITNSNYDVYDPAIPYNGGYYTTNGGSSWTQMASLNKNFVNGGYGSQGWYDLYLAVDPKNDQTVYGGGVDIADTTNARGASGNWQNITSVYGADNSNIHPDQHAVAFPACSAAPCAAYFGNDGGVYYSNNTTLTASSVTYTNLNTTGLAISEFTAGDLGPTYVNSRLALGGTQDNGTMIYRSNPVWDESLGGDGGYAVIDQSAPHIMYTENTGVSLAKSTDGGSTWNYAYGSITGSSLFYAPFTLDRANDQHLVFGASALWETLNGASTWYQDSQTFSTTVSAVAIAPSNSAVVYVGLSDGEMFRTTSAGTGTQQTYTAISLPTTGHYITSISVDPTDPNTAFVTTGQFLYDNVGHVWKTTNGGTSWTDIAGTLPTGYPVNTAVVYYSGSTRVIVIGTDYGVFFTTNDGAAWTRLSGNLPNAPVVWLAMDGARSTIAAYTHGRSVFTIDIPESVGGTGDTIGVFRPSQAIFYLRNSITSGPADTAVNLGTSSDIPVVGDWNGTGIDDLGVYRPSNATFYLTDSNTPGAPVTHFIPFGAPGDIPLIGDWTGSGRDTIGVYRPSTRTFYLKNSLSGGYPDYSMLYGASGDIPVVGDWPGQGHDTIGIFRPSTAIFYLATTNCNCAPSATYGTAFGAPGDTPFTGDWTHSGQTGLGLYRTSNGVVYLRNNATLGGYADFYLVYGTTNDVPVAGHWNTTAPTTPNRMP